MKLYLITCFIAANENDRFDYRDDVTLVRAMACHSHWLRGDGIPARAAPKILFPVDDDELEGNYQNSYLPRATVSLFRVTYRMLWARVAQLTKVKFRENGLGKSDQCIEKANEYPTTASLQHQL